MLPAARRRKTAGWGCRMGLLPGSGRRAGRRTAVGPPRPGPPFRVRGCRPDSPTLASLESTYNYRIVWKTMKPCTRHDDAEGTEGAARGPSAGRGGCCAVEVRRETPALAQALRCSFGGPCLQIVLRLLPPSCGSGLRTLAMAPGWGPRLLPSDYGSQVGKWLSCVRIGPLASPNGTVFRRFVELRTTIPVAFWRGRGGDGRLPAVLLFRIQPTLESLGK